MSDEDWVARLLRDAGSPAMPADVADRLDRTLRHEVDALARTDGPPDQATTASVGTAGGTSTERPVDQPTAASSGPAVPPAAGLVPPPAATRPRLVDGAEAPGTAGGTGAPVSADDRGTSRDQGPSRLRAVGTATGVGPARHGATRRELREEDAAERRRRLLTRLAPVAAGLLVLGGAGAVALTTLGGSGTEGTATLDAAGGAEDTTVPRALVATGTEYTTTDDEVFAEQVRELVAVAASGGSGAGAAAGDGDEAEAGADALAVPEAAEDAAGGATAGSEPADDPAAASVAAPPPDPAAVRAAVDGPLTDRQAFDTCIDQVTDGVTTPVTAVDLAVVDGLESTVVVVPDPSGENLFVYVVGPDCTEVDGPGFKFRQVTP